MRDSQKNYGGYQGEKFGWKISNFREEGEENMTGEKLRSERREARKKEKKSKISSKFLCPY